MVWGENLLMGYAWDDGSMRAGEGEEGKES